MVHKHDTMPIMSFLNILDIHISLQNAFIGLAQPVAIISSPKQKQHPYLFLCVGTSRTEHTPGPPPKPAARKTISTTEGRGLASGSVCPQHQGCSQQAQCKALPQTWFTQGLDPSYFKPICLKNK